MILKKLDITLGFNCNVQFFNLKKLHINDFFFAYITIWIHNI
jgi:hypothetical protein